MTNKNDAFIISAPQERRDLFWSHVNKTETCWLFTGAMSVGGYSKFSYKRRACSGQRAAKLWQTGVPQPDKMACHIRSCVNRHCVNPDHIYWGTPKDNMQDAVALKTGFYSRSFGEKHRSALFTNEQVKDIWMMLIKAPLSLKAIGDKYKTDSRNIYVIREKIAWRCVTDLLPPIPPMPKAQDFPPIIRRKHQTLTEAQIDQICEMLDVGITLNAVIKHASSNSHTINDVYFQRKGRMPALRGAKPRTKVRVKKATVRKPV